MQRPIGSLFVFALFCVLSARAGAAAIELSLFSSDVTPAEVLDALLEFSVVGDELTLTVSNNTSDPSPFEINEIAFNATAEVTNLSLTSGLNDWSLRFDQTPGGNHGMDGFGRFDVILEWGGGRRPTILPGEKAIFTFAVEGEGFSDLSFVTDLSSIPPGAMEMLLVAKFIRGPNDDSAFGAVPEPRSLGLLALGGLVMMWQRRGT
ncbi:MAG: PEP-CTERM sorting domain-containing protein [Planctomycetes bacterium]|nr:PEP-CTERM sorting domain-containing protein [Planctomycetota bacterium]